MSIPSPNIYAFTGKQQLALALASTGLSHREIARRLGIRHRETATRLITRARRAQAARLAAARALLT